MMVDVIGPINDEFFSIFNYLNESFAIVEIVEQLFFGLGSRKKRTNP